MFYKIEWVENKSKDWKVATVSAVDGTKQTDVSINRVSKKGDMFPDFDGITPGKEIGGRLWSSPAGKWYLFAPDKEEKTFNTFKKPNMSAVMEKKAENIDHAQDKKAEGIKVSSTIRMAVDMALAELGQLEMPYTPIDMQECVRKWRTWFWNEWEKSDKDFPPFNN